MSLTSAHFDRNARAEDRRAHFRQPVRSLAYVELGDGNGGIALNISEGGMAVQAVMSLGGDDLPALRVQLAHSKKQIQLKGRVAWTADLRKLAGVQFVDVSDDTRKQLREWISLESPDREISVLPDVSAAEEKEQTPATRASRPSSAMEFPLETEYVAGEEAPILASAAPAIVEAPKAPPVAFPSRPRNRVVPAAEVPPAFNPVAGSPKTEAPESAQSISADLASTVGPVSITAEGAKPEAPKMPSLPARLPSLPTRPAALPRKSASFFAAAPASEASAAVLTRDPAFLPEDRFGFKRPDANSAAKETKRIAPEKWKTSTWVAIFAVVALAAGWFAGHGSWKGGFQQAPANDASAAISDDDVSQPVTPSAPPPAQIEVVDLNNRRWLIPIGPGAGRAAPVAPPKSADATQETSAGPAATALSTLNPSQNADGSNKAAPAVVSASTSEPRNLTSAAAPSDTRSAAPVSAQQAVVQNDLLPGELIHKVEPEYPAAALDQKVEGTVKIMAVIDTSGNVKSAQPLSGPRVLIPAALDAVRQWKYGPTTLHGQAIETQRQITIVFEVAKTQ